MNEIKQHPLAEKSFQFGVESYWQCERMMRFKNQFVLTRQLIRSSAAVGALCAESEFAQSRADFINKLAIARKECNESRYWISMMHEVGLLESINSQSMQSKADELMRLLTASIKTAQSNLRK
jgi:four helix bundle protein